MSIGQIVQVIGAVVDIEFPRDQMPKVYDALILEKDEKNTLAEEGLTFEGAATVWVTAWFVPLPWAPLKACNAA